MVETAYAVDRFIDPSETATLIDYLKRIQGVELEYRRTFRLSQEAKAGFAEAVTQHTSQLEAELVKQLINQLGLTEGRINQDDIYINLTFAAALPLKNLAGLLDSEESQIYHFDEVEDDRITSVVLPLHFGDLDSHSIVREGFSVAEGSFVLDEVNRVHLLTIENQALGSSGLGDKYRLMVYDVPDGTPAKDVVSGLQNIFNSTNR